MSMEFMVLVNKHKFDSPLKKLIFLQLADNADKNGRCYPSYSYISDRSSCGKSTVRKHIKELEKLGYLKIKNRVGVKGNSSNIYHIQKHKLQADPVAPDSTGVCHEVAQGVAPDSTPPVAPDSTVTSHLLEPVIEPKESKSKKPDLSEVEQPENLNLSAWQKWMTYKLEIKKKYKTPTGIKTAMNNLAKLTHEQQQNCIDEAVGREWQGFRAEDHTGVTSGNKNNQKQETIFERNERLAKNLKAQAIAMDMGHNVIEVS